MSLSFFAVIVLLVTGNTLLLGSFHWFQRPSHADRLATFHHNAAPTRRGSILSVESFRDVVGPLTGSIGAQLAQLFGIRDDLDARLLRIHSPLDPAAFRIRQFGWMGGALVVGATFASLSVVPMSVGFLLAVGAPLLAFLIVEHQLSTAIEQRQEQVVAELPVVAEQLGMLLSAGYSLGSALGRIAERGSGACSDDFSRVRRRMQQGLSDVEALREWAATIEVSQVGQLVSVLALNREATDLGFLISTEARAIRAQSHRDLIATIERRTQQVWIPVTVATLLPGVIFMAIPFVEALSLFSSPS